MGVYFAALLFVFLASVFGVLLSVTATPERRVVRSRVDTRHR